MAKKLDNALLYLEAKEILLKHDKDTTTEVTINKIMNTKRRFRTDFYCPNLKLIVEVNGGEWKQGRHVRGQGYADDLRKANISQLNDFYYLQYTYTQLNEGKLIEDMEILIKELKNEKRSKL